MSRKKLKLLITFGFSKISENKKSLYSQSEYFTKCSKRESIRRNDAMGTCNETYCFFPMMG
jgi:hypothetical protein